MSKRPVVGDSLGDRGVRSRGSRKVAYLRKAVPVKIGKPIPLLLSAPRKILG